MLVYLPLVFAGAVLGAVGGSEQGSYVNPNPRQYDNCEVQDLVQLSACCNDVLNKLDDCKANDLACECCALQSLKQDCYGLCQGNPSNNFLTALFDDCASLNDVNACNLPFRKDDSQPPAPARPASEETGSAVVVKSRVRQGVYGGDDGNDDGDDDGDGDGGGDDGDDNGDEVADATPEPAANSTAPIVYANATLAANHTLNATAHAASDAGARRWDAGVVILVCSFIVHTLF